MNQRQWEVFLSMTENEIIELLTDLWNKAKITGEFPPVHRKIFVHVIDERGNPIVRIYADANTYTPGDFVIAGLEEFVVHSPEEDEAEFRRFVEETLHHLNTAQMFEDPNTFQIGGN